MLDIKYKSLLKMAIPLMASTFIQSIVMLTDSAFLSRYSTIDFDASGNGGLLYITMFMTVYGLNDGAQILMARRIGENKNNSIAQIFGTTLIANLLLVTGLFIIAQTLLPQFITSYSAHPLIAEAEIEFLTIRSFSLFLAMITLAINAYFMSTGKTTVVFISALIIAATNILLDYLLIDGKFGFSELGIKGAALASTIADGFGMLFLIICLKFGTRFNQHQLFNQIKFNAKSFKNLLKIGYPIMLQGLLALSTWTIFFTWIEQTGEHELTVSQNIRSIYFLAFVPIVGFGATTKTYVSQYYGNKDFDSIKIVQKRIQLLTVLFMVIIFHGALLYPATIVSFINPNPEYIESSVAILRFVSGSILIYSFTNVYFHSINGSGNTRATLYIEIISVFLYIVSAYLFIKIFKLDIFWVWSVEYIYFLSCGLLSIAYLKFFNWKKKII